MPVKTTVLFQWLRGSIAPLIVEKLRSSIDARMLTGFAAPLGIDVLLPALVHRPDAVHTLVVSVGAH